MNLVFYFLKMFVLVGSKNPVKVGAVVEAFSNYFKPLDVEGIEVSSTVLDQPLNADIYEGAKQRALALQHLSQEKYPHAEYFVGIEGGVEHHFGHWFASGVICIVNKEGQMSFGKSPHFTLPPFVLEKVLNGEELGKVMGSYVGQHDLSKTSGAIGVLTRGVIDRKELYVSGILMALVPFLSPSLYFSSQTEVI